MKKLKLHLNELKVETFNADNSKPAAGTINANIGVIQSVDMCIFTEQGFTCLDDCNWTQQFTCVGNCTDSLKVC